MNKTIKLIFIFFLTFPVFAGGGYNYDGDDLKVYEYDKNNKTYYKIESATKKRLCIDEEATYGIADIFANEEEDKVIIFLNANRSLYGFFDSGTYAIVFELNYDDIKDLIEKYNRWYKIAEENGLLDKRYHDEIEKELGCFVVFSIDPDSVDYTVKCTFKISEYGDCKVVVEFNNISQSVKREVNSIDIQILDYSLAHAKEIAAQIKEQVDEENNKKMKLLDMFE